MAQKYILLAAAVLGILAVILGAFGAHGLKPRLEAEQFQSFQTGVLYHFLHVLAILAVGILWYHLPSRWIITAGWLFLIGIIFFSGSIYLLSTRELTGLAIPKIVAMLTPLGGLFLIGGWASLGIGILLHRT